jgi:hypothetical protein
MPGKPIVIPTWKLQIKATPLLIINYEQQLYPADHPHLVPSGYFEDIKFGISVNDQVLINYHLDYESKMHEFEFEDLESVLQIKISASGFARKKAHTSSGQIMTDVIGLDIWIENLCVDDVLETPGRYINDSGQIIVGAKIMGIDGHQILTIQTPIWTWLMQHRQLVMQPITKQYSQNN